MAKQSKGNAKEIAWKATRKTVQKAKQKLRINVKQLNLKKCSELLAYAFSQDTFWIKSKM